MPKALERRLERQAAKKFPYPKKAKALTRKRIKRRRGSYVYGTMNKLGLLRK